MAPSEAQMGKLRAGGVRGLALGGGSVLGPLVPGPGLSQLAVLPRKRGELAALPFSQPNPTAGSRMAH